MWDGVWSPLEHGLPKALFVTAEGGKRSLMLHLWRAEAQGFGLLPKITHSLREVKWGTDPFPSVRYTVEFQCLRDRAMSAPILVYVSTFLF